MPKQNIITKISALFGIIMIMGVLCTPTLIIRAQTTGQYTLLEPLPCIPGTGNNCTKGSTTPTVNIQTYVVYIFKIMIAVAVFATVVMVIIGGFQYMLTDSVTKKGDAKSPIQNALMGLTGALFSYLILYTINPQLVNISLITVPKLNLTVQSINTNNTSATDALKQAATQNQQVSNAAKSDLQAAKDNVTNLQDSLVAQNCMDTNGTVLSNDPACKAIVQQLQTAQAQVATAQSTAIVAQGNKFFAVTASQDQSQNTGSDQQTIINTISNELSANTKEYNTLSAQLKANNDIKGQAALTASYQAAQQTLQARSDQIQNNIQNANRGRVGG